MRLTHIRHRNEYNILFLIIFLTTTLFINFFHTETNLLENDNCPACNFLNSSFATNIINFFHIPLLSLFSILEIFESFNYTYIFSIDSLARSPPRI